MTALKKITTQAKKIRKRFPRKSWKAAIKMAGQQYRAGKISGVRPKKKTAKKRPVKKRRKLSGMAKVIKFKTPRRVTNVTHYAGGMVGSISQHKNAARKLIAEKLGWLEVQIISAKTVRQKNALGKRRAEYMRQARALS